MQNSQVNVFAFLQQKRTGMILRLLKKIFSKYSYFESFDSVSFSALVQPGYFIMAALSIFNIFLLQSLGWEFIFLKKCLLKLEMDLNPAIADMDRMDSSVVLKRMQA